MKKKVWILSHYANGDYFDKGGRHYWISKYLKQSGYKPVIFCSNAKHKGTGLYFENKKLFHIHEVKEIGVPFVFIKGRPYTGNGKQRILNMIDFYVNVKRTTKIYAKRCGRPDVIYASSVHPLTLLAGLQIAKYFKIKCICEVRDLWPESIVAYGLLNRSSLIAKGLYQLEKYLYINCDKLIFTMEGAYDYIIDKGWERDISREKVHFINNGIDLEVFNYNKENFQFVDTDLNNPDIFKVVYAGSIRRVNNVGMLLEVAKQVKNSRVRFLIWGDGDELCYLKEYKNREGINNVIFKGRVEKKYIPYIVSHADLNLAHQEATNIAKYGMSLNKMFDYAAAGKPILFDFKSNHNPILAYGAGEQIKDYSVKGIAQAIDKMCGLNEEKIKKYAVNAAIVAKKYDYKKLAAMVAEIIQQV